jgi:archaellum component FlaC
MSKNKPKSTNLEDIADAINILAGSIDERFEQVENRFDAMDKRFDAMDKRFDAMDKRFDSLEDRVANLEKGQRELRHWVERIDGRLQGVESDVKEIYDRLLVIEKRLPNITEAEIREIQHKLEIITDWAKTVSKRYGVPLPKL